MKSQNKVLLILLGGFILSFIGFYNGYPLVYSDTGTYIYSGFSRFIPLDRPITYGLFLSIFSFHYSTWFVIIVQNVFTSWVVFELLSFFFKEHKHFNPIFLTTILFLVTFTGIGWYSNQLMPDFFAPLSILLFFVLISKHNISIFTRVFLNLIFLYSLITHFSHLMMLSILVMIVLVFRYFLREKLSLFSMNRLLITTVVVFSGWFALPAINYIVEKQFILSKGSHVFLMGHLVDTGILKEFLKANCDNPEFSDCELCKHMESIPEDAASFIWSGDLLEKSGGWENSREEYRKIILGTIKQPRFLLANLYKSFTYGLIQLAQNEIGHGLTSYKEGSAPYGQVHWRFNHELNNYLNSRQNKWDGVNLNFEILNTLHTLLLLFSLFLTLLFFTVPLYRKIKKDTIVFLVYCLLGILVNSFVTAGLNTPYGRYQARVVWIFPLAVLIVLYQNYPLIRQYYK